MDCVFTIRVKNEITDFIRKKEYYETCTLQNPRYFYIINILKIMGDSLSYSPLQYSDVFVLHMKIW